MAQTEGRYNTTVLASEISKSFNLPKAQALRIISGTFTAIGNALARGEVVSVHSFGNFKPLKTKQRAGRNPKTGEETTIMASIRPHFVAAQNLKNKVKDKKEEAIDVATAAIPAPKKVAKPVAKAAPKAAVAPPAGKPVAKPTGKPVAKAPVAEPEIDEL